MEIEAKDLAVRFGRITLLRKINVAIRAGEMVGLIGPNGSGKTTLLRILANLRPPDDGAVSYSGLSAAEIGARRLSQQIAYLAQGASVHWPMRVETLVGLGRLPHRRPMRGLSSGDRTAIERAMVACDVIAFRDRSMSEVSGGERLRILLARALAVEAEMLLADEPIAALDPLHQLQVMELLKRTTLEDRAVVVVLHDLALAARYCDRLVLLAGGGILAEGKPSDVLTDAHIATAYGVDVARGQKDGVPYLLPWLPTAATGRSLVASTTELTGKRVGVHH
jgi:iron complex transport system ATP-binding protein